MAPPQRNPLLVNARNTLTKVLTLSPQSVHPAMHMPIWAEPLSCSKVGCPPEARRSWGRDEILGVRCPCVQKLDYPITFFWEKTAGSATGLSKFCCPSRTDQLGLSKLVIKLVIKFSSAPQLAGDPRPSAPLAEPRAAARACRAPGY